MPVATLRPLPTPHPSSHQHSLAHHRIPFPSLLPATFHVMDMASGSALLLSAVTATLVPVPYWFREEGGSGRIRCDGLGSGVWGKSGETGKKKKKLVRSLGMGLKGEHHSLTRARVGPAERRHRFIGLSAAAAASERIMVSSSSVGTERRARKSSPTCRT